MQEKKKEAQLLFASTTYGPSRWRTLESYNLNRSLSCQASTGSGRDELLSALAALRAGISDAGIGWSVSRAVTADQNTYAQSLLARVRDRASELEKGISAFPCPASNWC